MSDFPAVLVCEMSDGTKRLVVTSRGVPIGAYNSGEQTVEFSVNPSPTPVCHTVEPPPSVPFDFYDYGGIAENYPFEPILAELLFTWYEYNEQFQDATWSSSLFVDGVNLNVGTNWIWALDESAVVLAVFE